MTEIYKCTPREARRYISDILHAGLVPFVQSSPGIGKSSIMRSISNELNLKLIDHRLSTSAPEDLSGLPEFYNNPQGERRSRFVPFGDLFPLAGDPLPIKTPAVYSDKDELVTAAVKYDGWMIFLDEFNSASKSVQAASYKLILDRQVGQYHLHDNVVIAAAGNLDTDRAITNKLSTAMQSRVVHLVMEADFECWLYDVALKGNYDSRIIAYLSQYKGKLMDFRPDHQDKTFCCPRTWEFVNRLITNRNIVDSDAQMLAGAITSGTAVDFVQFCKIYKDLVTIEQVLADPKTCPLPGDQNLRWATITHLMGNVTLDNLPKLRVYVDRFTTDFRILFYRSVLVRQPNIRQSPAFVSAMAELAQWLHG